MGLKDKMLAKSAQITAERKGFTPLELNEGNVQAIFNRCLEKETERGHGKKNYAQILQVGLSGKDSPLVVFDYQRMVDNQVSISYLFGQLKLVHENCRLMKFEHGGMAYQDNRWITHIDTLFKFYELGMANGNILPFTLQDDNKTLLTDVSHIIPTLSPKDPNFPAWWEEHKAEWEE